ncbi:MAG TPA: MoxR family ATPase [Burkholderiaceae bacterium]|nr:MoxR family ATPase [Burkholderiaceae bacterium]HMY98859.1 MoxR family ATPase [Burkholderiaceae bacterium]HNB44857.1 MoxR family ATPase [Burkholderiaceae bacterium]HNG79300.1 MoxR family ATPase [Burkholderiaceae bacterium]
MNVTKSVDLKYFDPAKLHAGKQRRANLDAGYVFTDNIVLAVNVSLATHRPLLVTGNPGTGKSMLAEHVAALLDWKFYKYVVTSRTRARDLMWRFDAIRRLAAAQESAHTKDALKPLAAYVEPSVLWWAFNPASAGTRGAQEGGNVPSAEDPSPTAGSTSSVVLIDEIDKAEPDVPNDLLEALDRERFTVEELSPSVSIHGKKENVMLVITSNRERDLPGAFMRRCVALHLEPPTKDQLVRIAQCHFPGMSTDFQGKLAERILELQRAATQRMTRPPGTAEYLDLLRACHELGVTQDSPQWLSLERLLLLKTTGSSTPRADLGSNT